MKQLFNNDNLNNGGQDESKPPSPICQSVESGICHRVSCSLSAWLREVAIIRDIPCPDFRVRVRYDLDVLETTGRIAQ